MYCQKCRSPLHGHGGFGELNPAAFDLIVGNTSKSATQAAVQPQSDLGFPQERKQRYDQAVKQGNSPLHRRTIPAPRDANPDMSFIEITESQVISADRPNQQHNSSNAATEGLDNTDKPNLSSQLARHEKLYALLSARSDIDHPICAECSSMMVTAMYAKLATATRERDAYAAFLKQLQHAASKQSSDTESMKREAAKLREEEQSLLAELVSIEEKKTALEKELVALDEEHEELELQESQFWLARNAASERQHDLEADLASLQQKYKYDQKQFERLQRTNVYNDTFYVSHDGTFGTINGLRLGRSPTVPVEWPEINAAWGQTLLLLQTLAERLSFAFQGYKLRPLGSTSRIEKYEYPAPSQSAAVATTGAKSATPVKVTVLELYSSGATLERVFQARKFDQGMVAFLDCLKQLGNHVERTSQAGKDSQKPSLSRVPSHATTMTSSAQPMRLPYAIEGDKIWNRDGTPEQGVSIKLGVGFSTDDDFTKACKYVLTCCKYLLAHVSNLDSAKSNAI